MKRLISIVIVFAMLFAAAPISFANALGENMDTPDSFTKEDRDYFIKYGDYNKNDDGSYSFVIRNDVNVVLNSNETVHSQDILTIIPFSDEESKEIEKSISLMRSGGDTTLTDSDEAGCVSAYSNIKWSTTNQNGREYVYLISASGGYTASGSGAHISSGVSVTAHKVTMGQSGFVSGAYKSQQVTYNIGTSNRSFQYSPPSSWAPIDLNGGNPTVGTTYTISLKRGSDSHIWYCIIDNNI